MGMMDFLRKPKAEEPFTETTFECKRGCLTIRGTEYRPEGENLPAAIISHGFMAWQDTVRQYAKELARMGYCAYCFDFCGGSVMKKSKSDGETIDMSVLTEVQDLEAVIEYVQSLPYTGNTLLLMGCSQGGFVSALVAAKHPELVSKLVLFYPALCIPDDARAGKMMFAKFDPMNIPERINCGPMKLGRCYVADVIDMDPIEKIRTYRGPVLIVHGTKDNIVDPDYSRQAQRVYPNAKLHIIEGGAHGFGKKTRCHRYCAFEKIRWEEHRMKIYDISQEVFSCAVYPGDPQPEKQVLYSTEADDLYNLTSFAMCAHNGTHVDAPFHFIHNGKTVDQMDLTHFVGDCFVARHECDITDADAKEILKKSGGAERILIAGKATVTAEAAEVFAAGNIRLLGNEGQTVGPEDAPMQVHLILLRSGIVLLEGVVLDNVPEGRYFLSAAPLNLGGADGAPCRAYLIDWEESK